MIEIEDNEILYNKRNGIEYIQFKKLLEFNIKHAYTLKSENTNFYFKSENEMESYKKLFSALDLNIDSLVKPMQTHTSVVKCIDSIKSSESLNNVDGLITDKTNITLATVNADCILFLFFDPIKKIIANVHSGWRGTFQKIAEKTVVKMINNYNCNPKDIMCFICPSIRKCHFEVDEDVKQLCEEIFSFTNRTNEFIEKSLDNNSKKYYIDTVLINKILLEELGVKKENIIDCNICSVCNKDKIVSYRAGDKEIRGTAIISL